MASSVLVDAQELQQKLSSSRIISEPEFQVFLSHAGKQKPFVFDLCKDFVNWPRSPTIYPFFDQSDKSLPKGEEFPDRIFEAARKCVVAVVILTKEYVTSKWPMLELLAFVEAQKTTNPGLKLLPVFYEDLPTSDIEDCVVVDDTWFAKWKEAMPKSGGTSPVVHRNITLTPESCKEALRKLRKINGLVMTNNMPMESLRHRIVKAALNFLPSSSEMDTENVQGCLRLCESISGMFQKNGRGVYCLGLYGMGGLGKTTMCKALCSYFGPFLSHKVCHLEIGSNDKSDVNEEKFKRHIKILKWLSDVPEEQIVRLEYTHDYYQAEKCVQQCLSNTRYPKFLAVDNVQDGLASCQEAEDYLKWLSPGSIIIITSRSRDNVRSVTRNPVYCKPIPNLKQEEAMTLFLKIAAPEVDQLSLNPRQIRILKNCLQICFFSSKKEIKLDQVPGNGGDQTVNGETDHYHPLALRAVASYLKDLYSGQDSILCWEKVLKKQNIMLFHARDSIEIFKVLGIGFKNMSELSKQLFIDVALYAPPPVEAEDIFNWLVSIHHEYKPQIVQEKLRQLRKKSFLNYDDGTPLQESCENISMHELYREFAKRYLGKKNARLFRYGVYDGGDLSLPSLEDPGWAIVPRIHLQRLTDIAKVKEWCSVAVVNLVGCEEITTVPIGELLSLRHLTIVDCPKLEVLSWTQDIASEQLWGKKLCFVDLFSNKSLRKIPDFSTCSELQNITVKECSSSVEPIRLHTCSNLQVLHLEGNDVPEVQSIQSCPKLRSVRLAWKATHKGLPLLDNVPCLSKLKIEGPSDVPFDQMDCYSPLFGKNQFWKQHPEDSVCHDLSGVGVLSNLETVHLSCIPLGKLPVELATVGSSLLTLTLSGCLLSHLVDFSAFPNLHRLKIRWTNVEEVRGLEHLKNLRYLDCSYCFQLQKVPDLRPLSKLEKVYFLQCPKLQGIPRLPAGCIRRHNPDIDIGSEDEGRALLATAAFIKTAAKALLSPGFGIDAGGRSRSIPSQPCAAGWAIHVATTCDGCLMFPLVGRRYKAKPVRTRYSLCSTCFSNKCYRNKCSDTEKTKPRWEAEGELLVEYDLCFSCYKKSGRDLRSFYEIGETHLPDGGPQRTLTHLRELGPILMSIAGSAVDLEHSTSYTRSLPHYYWGPAVFTLKVNSSPFNMKWNAMLYYNNGPEGVTSESPY